MSELNRLGFDLVARDYTWPHLPIVIADMDTGEMLVVSEDAATLFGYTPAELGGKPVELLVPEDVREPHANWRKGFANGGRMMSVGRAVRGRRKDGSTFTAHLGLASTETLGRRIAIALVVDLTGIVERTAQTTASGIIKAAGMPRMPHEQ